MKPTWQIKQLDDICEIEYGTRVVQKRNGGNVYPVYGGGGATFRMDEFNREDRLVVARFAMSEQCVRFVRGKFYLNDSGLTVSPKKGTMLPRFLDYQLLSRNDEIYCLGRGTAQKNLDVPAFRSLQLAVPDNLIEQQRIVAILDEAFDGIATAKANAEKNLQNARALFESRLQTFFVDCNEGWAQKRLHEVSKDFGRGKSKHRPRNDAKLYGGKYPFIQTGDVRNATHLITSYSQTYNEVGLAQSKLWPRGTLCITIAANIAETGILDFDACFPDSVIGVVVDETKTTSKFLEYLLQSFKTKLQAKGKGSAQDNINLGTFENHFFPFPRVEVQRSIVATLDSLSAETRRLESIYQKKLAALDELKKSLLYEAFTGELTKQIPQSVVIPSKIPKITTTDLHCGFIAIAYQLHENEGKTKYYGHVKAEKIVHMLEAHVGIELERNPIQDAAGPNDYARFKNKVEPRAKKANYFKYEGSEKTGYRFYKLGQFNSLVTKTRAALGNLNQAVDDLLALMLPMNTQQAEVFATVYAAWNNLLLDREPITHEAIVSAAREHWHPDKLRIPRENFFAAVNWMKQKGVVPKGIGKKVVSKTIKK